MNTEYRELINWADTIYTERDSDFIDKWLVGQENKNDAVNRLAIFLAKSYVDGTLSFDIASTLLNQTMPVIGFEEAPEVFWSFYSAFEDYEMLDNPDPEAIPRIRNELLAINEI